jgi:thiol-disulfide isomerase/thioredoxin
VRRAIVICSAAAIVLTGCSSNATGSFSYAPVSGMLPALGGQTLQGGTLSPDQYRGRVVVVNFWNYDCPPCRREQPVLQQAWQRLRAKGVSVIGVMYTGGGWPASQSAAADYVTAQGVTYPAIVDAGSVLSRSFRIPGIPTTVIADRTGHLRYRVLGPLKPGELESIIATLGSP